MRILSLTPLSLFLSLTLTLPSQAQVIATVGSKKITVKEFNRRYQDVVEQTINPPNKKDFLEDLIRYEIGLQEARKTNLQNDPAVRERMNQELYKALVENALAEKVERIKVSDREMQSYYKKNPEIRTRHILTEFKPDATPEQIAAARKRATKIRKEVVSSKRPFKDLVKIYSDDPISKRNGGDVGWQTRLTLVPNYYDSALQLGKNKISGLVKTQFGFHIIQLTGVRPFKEANRKNIRIAVFDIKRKKLFDDYFRSLKKKYRISVNRKNLK